MTKLLTSLASLGKLKSLYVTNRTYINLTFTLIVIAFSYAIKKGDLKIMVEVLKVAQTLLSVILTGAGG